MNGMLNGIDVQRLHRTITEVGKEPEKGRFTTRTRTEWGVAAAAEPSSKGATGQMV